MADFLKDLLDCQGNAVDASTLKGKLVALYFGAHWCPPCKMFTPMLKDLYEDVKDGSPPFEVVFVSSDDSKEDAASYMAGAHGSWLQVAYDSPLRNELKRKYGCCAGKEQGDAQVAERRNGIPALVVVQPGGEELCFDGVEQVKEHGPTAVKRWREALQK